MGGTGVSASADMGSVLKTQFNYSSATRADYDYSKVVSNLNANKPVILSGNNPNGPGHMWVTDGYRTTTFYRSNCTGIEYLNLHMIWGWGDEYNNNGYYSFTNFNPGNNNYNDNKEMIYNITP